MAKKRSLTINYCTYFLVSNQGGGPLGGERLCLYGISIASCVTSHLGAVLIGFFKIHISLKNKSYTPFNPLIPLL